MSPSNQALPLHHTYQATFTITQLVNLAIAPNLIPTTSIA